MTVERAKKFFFNLHDVEVNQKYNKILPYSFHLEMVHIQYIKFGHLLTIEENEIASIASYGHDSIEDARLTYNDLKTEFNIEVAEVIYLCTENKGRNRLARKGDEWYKDLSTNDLAIFVKLCDVIANVKFSLLTNSSMFGKYKQEYNHFRSLIYKERFKTMFEYLDKLFANF